MDTDPLLQPIVQYGFAGFCAVLLGILVWLVRALLAVLKETNGVIDRNTDAITACNVATAEVRAEVRGMKEEFLRRPCIAHHQPKLQAS